MLRGPDAIDRHPCSALNVMRGGLQGEEEKRKSVCMCTSIIKCFADLNTNYIVKYKIGYGGKLLNG